MAARRIHRSVIRPVSLATMQRFAVRDEAGMIYIGWIPGVSDCTIKISAWAGLGGAVLQEGQSDNRDTRPDNLPVTHPSGRRSAGGPARRRGAPVKRCPRDAPTPPFASIRRTQPRTLHQPPEGAAAAPSFRMEAAPATSLAECGIMHPTSETSDMGILMRTDSSGLSRVACVIVSV